MVEMIRDHRGLVLVACLSACAMAAAQDPTPPAAPPPSPTPFSVRTGPEMAPPPVRVVPLPGPYVPPPPVPPPPCPPLQDCNGTLLAGDPLLDRPDYPPPGWFTSLDIGFVKPHLKNRLTEEVTIDGVGTDVVRLPSASLGWTVSPRFEFGYRFPQGFGEVVLAYQFLTSEGSTVLPDFDFAGIDGFLKSRLNMNVVDLDYASREYALNTYWDMKWRVGVRVATVFFDSQASGLFLEGRTSNHFVGAGPRAGLELWRCLPVAGLSLFGKVDGSAVLGRIRQSFEETVLVAPDFAVGGSTVDHGSQAVPVVRVQAGLGWTPALEGHWLRFALGYEYEQWWFVGRLEDSAADLTLNGFFFRMDYRY